MEFVAGTSLESERENIWVACSDGDIARVRELLLEGVSVNSQDESGYSPMHAAVSYGHKSLIELLLSASADINIRDADGDTPILVCEDPEIFEYMIQAGANPNDLDENGAGILEKAIEDENETMIEYLIEKGFVARERVEELVTKQQLQAAGFEFHEMEDDDEDEDASEA